MPSSIVGFSGVDYHEIVVFLHEREIVGSGKTCNFLFQMSTTANSLR